MLNLDISKALVFTIFIGFNKESIIFFVHLVVLIIITLHKTIVIYYFYLYWDTRLSFSFYLLWKSFFVVVFLCDIMFAFETTLAILGYLDPFLLKFLVASAHPNFPLFNNIL